MLRYLVLSSLIFSSVCLAEEVKIDSQSKPIVVAAARKQRTRAKRRVVSSNEETSMANESHRGVNIWVNPLSLVFSNIDGGVNFRVGKGLAVGPVLGLNFGAVGAGSSVFGYRAGLRLNVTPMSDVFESGLYIAAQASYYGISYTVLNTKASYGMFYLAGLGGYQFFLPSGFNIAGGVGLVYVVGSSILFSGASLGLELNIGYAL